MSVRITGGLHARILAACAALAVFGGALVSAQIAGDRQWEQDEKAVRQAAFRYYAGMVLGDADMCAAAVAFPLYALRNGTGVQRDEKTLRALVADIARRGRGASLSDAERKQVLSNMLAIFDDADIRFVGGDTATVVFVLKPPASPDAGETLAELVLYRKAGKWLVVAEITDSKPAPRMPDVTETLSTGKSLEQRPK